MMRSMKKRLRDVQKKTEWALKEAQKDVNVFLESHPIPSVCRLKTDLYFYRGAGFLGSSIKTGETVTILDVIPRLAPFSMVTVFCLSESGVGYLNFDRSFGPISDVLKSFLSS